MSNDPTSRRRFLSHVLIAAAAVPLIGQANRAWAASLPKLPVSNPQAVSLHYVEDASKDKDPAHKAGSMCSNCQFFTASTGACALFAGFQVSPKGWCSAWAKKA